MMKKEKLIYLNLIFLGILAIIFVLYFWENLIRLIRHLLINDDYSYGLLIPVVSGYIVYQKWPEIRKINWQPSWMGLIIIVGGLCLNIIGELAAEIYTTRIAMIVTLGGIVDSYGGLEPVTSSHLSVISADIDDSSSRLDY